MFCRRLVCIFSLRFLLSCNSQAILSANKHPPGGHVGNARQRALGRQLASADTTAHPSEPQRCQTGTERGQELLSGGSGSPSGDTSNYQSGSSEKFSQLNPYRCISDFFFFNYIATYQSKCVWSVLYSPHQQNSDPLLCEHPSRAGALPLLQQRQSPALKPALFRRQITPVD